MSEPKRYEHMSDGMGRWFINPRTGKLAPYGEYVMSSDYARLEAEVERLRNIGIKLDGYVDLLQAEVDRLRKAGDAMAETILKDCIHKNDIAALKWYAAKEGKQP